jgi:outer membrane protein assembly factor BamB
MRRRLGVRSVFTLSVGLALFLTLAWPAGATTRGGVAEPRARHAPGPQAADAGSVPSGWPQAGYSPDGARWNPNEVVLSTSNVSSLVERWGQERYSNVVVNHGTVYGTAYDGTEYRFEARSARTGALRWRSSFSGHWPYATPAATDTRVCTAGGSYFGSVYCVDARTGSLLWRRKSGGRNVVLDGDALYVFSSEGITALDPDTGARIWPTTGAKLRPAAGAKVRPADPYDGPAYPSLVVADGRVFVVASGTYDPSGYPEWSDVFELDPLTGQTIWYQEYDVLLALVARNGLLYLAGPDQAMALSPDDGHVVWQHHVDQGTANVPPTLAVTPSTVYVHTDYGQVAALDAATGAGLWRMRLNSYMTPGGMAAANGVLYVGGDSGLAALDASTGRILFQQTGPNESGDTIVADGQVYTEEYVPLIGTATHVLGLPG